MIRSLRSLKVAASAAVFVLAASVAAQAQFYATNFDSGTDILNGVATPAVYTSPANPTDPLDQQNGWVTNDTPQTGTYGTSTQLVGRSNFVGATGYFSGQQGVIGGVYRTPGASATGAAPDVIPSTVTGGVATIARPFTLTGTRYTVGVDFALTSPGTFATTRDSFAFTLRNSTGTLLSITFTPGNNTVGGQLTDTIGYSVGATSTTTPNAVILNSQYHLTVSVNVTTNTFIATITGTNGAQFVGNAAGNSLTGSAITAGTVDRLSADWRIADTATIANGGYTNAGSNTLIFDNINAVVPEPSTYAMMGLGFLGLGMVLRFRRQQA